MSAGRVVSTVVASLAVAGCAVVAIEIAQDGSGRPVAHQTARHFVPPTPRPAHPPVHRAPSSSAAPARYPARHHMHPSKPARPSPSGVAAVSSTSPATPPVPAAPSSSTHPPRPPHPTTAPAPPATPSATPSPARSHRTVSAPGHRLPLKFGTHNATEVITVVAGSRSNTTATLQAWTKLGHNRWRKHGRSVTAWVGADGLGHASETRSATPIGSFTLTRAFGADSDPGTALPYLHTNLSDWWISQAGPLYNTHQRCSSHCPFTQGDPNEHLYTETPYYDYAVVIDYNTRNAPGGVRPGKGSAFFLHVHPSGTGPTAGCVSIPQAKLVHLMRWLRPGAHPRILIGTG